MPNSFWSGGAEAHCKGLEEHYEPRLAELRDRLKSSTEDTQRESLAREIQSVEREYERKREGIEWLLF